MTPTESGAVTAAKSVDPALDMKLKKNVYETDNPVSRPLRDQFRLAAEVLSLLVVDIFALAAAFAVAYYLRVFILPWIFPAFPAELPRYYALHLWWLPLVVLGSMAYEGLYTKRLSFWREAALIMKSVFAAFILALAVVTLAKTGGEVSRTLIVLSGLLAFMALPVLRYAGKNALYRAGIWVRRVVVLGAGETGRLVVQALHREPFMGYRVAGFLDDDPRKKNKPVTINGHIKVPVLGGFRDTDQVMRHFGVYNFIVAAPGMASRELVGLVNRLQRCSESVLVVPDLFGLPVMGAEADYFFDEQILGLRLRNNLASRTNSILKRAFDLTADSLIMLLCIPFFTLIVLAIKLDSPGPVIFAHRRIGRNGKEFMCYKFRTMVVNAQEALDRILNENKELRSEWKRDFKLKNDPRITRVGKFLRKTSLDELPQMLNVLKGNMSLAGPRPIIQQEIEKYAENIRYFYQVRPGMTGLWQVSGRSETDYDYRVQLDTWYVRNWSLWLDITLLIRTIAVVLARKGAY
jgi:undecaprenyl-phosphate galactose phosphotransferase